MAREVWPSVRQRTPGAVLHLFAGQPWAQDREARIVRHPPLEHSAAAFAPGAVLAVPLRVASGIRMKILEAWARGLAVVATPTAAAGLGARDGKELLLADDAGSFAAALARLANEQGLAADLTARGRRLLQRRHAPVAVAHRLLEIYRAAGGGRGASAGEPLERRDMIAVP
jgi:glycosyltransferase involved in cell wall biosynthesis